MTRPFYDELCEVQDACMGIRGMGDALKAMVPCAIKLRRSVPFSASLVSVYQMLASFLTGSNCNNTLIFNAAFSTLSTIVSALFKYVHHVPGSLPKSCCTRHACRRSLKLRSPGERGGDLFYPGSEPVAMKLIVFCPLYVHHLVE